MERTLALIKPDAVHRADEIVDAVQAAGFIVLNVRGARLPERDGPLPQKKKAATPGVAAAFAQKRRVKLSLEQTSEFYIEHYGKDFFPHLISFMSR
jgi:nucleoside-diphosphate kinase